MPDIPAANQVLQRLCWNQWNALRLFKLDDKNGDPAMNDFLTLDDLQDITGKAVLVRVDLNVPMKDGKVTDDTRIRAIFPTLKELADKNAKIILLSHFGRPKGEKNPEFSLEPVMAAFNAILAEHQLDLKLRFHHDCVGQNTLNDISTMANGDVLLCENLRFYGGEEKNDPAFAEQLAALGDIFVNDAFSAAHRAHASTYGLATLRPAYAGRLMEAELKALSAALENPERPVAAVVGGAKISTKLSVLNHLINKVDYLILGGGMANTFLHAEGVDIGASLHEADMAEEARAIMAAAKDNGCKILLPQDVVVAKEFQENAPHRNCDIHHINETLAECRTVLWNGPLGAFEIQPFDKATVEVAQKAAQLTEDLILTSVAGGGDTVSALEHAGVKHLFSYVSTAGGAFLEYIEGSDLPGVRILKEYAHKNAA
jgi:phosphoglycerate kinase